MSFSHGAAAEWPHFSWTPPNSMLADLDLRLIGLETAEDNLPAQQFYAKRGYRKVDEIEGYYGDGSTAWVMVKELGE